MTNDLTEARLKEFLRYEPETGHFYWRVNRGGIWAGSIAGSLKSDGYIRISIDDRLHRAHRLAFLYMLGKSPPEQVDHINGVRNDNRWVNLRLATNSQNQQNSKRSRINSSGFKGVHFDRKYEKWSAKIQLNGRLRHLGYFDSPENAAKVYKETANLLFGEFAKAL